MTDLRKAAEMALDALNIQTPLDKREFELRNSAIEALRQALAQHVDAVNMSQECVDEMAKCKHEPVAWQDPQYKTLIEPHKAHPDWIPLYTAPPKREWVSATHIEIGNLWAQHKEVYGFAMALDNLLKEKNCT